MSTLGRVLLPLLALLACQGDVVTSWTRTLRTNMLRESITMLDQLQKTEVSCNEMNVTNIFADDKRGDPRETLCKAATVARQGRSCHRSLEGIYDNLLGLLRGSRMEHKAPCPVAAGSTTSLKNFLKELHRELQEQYKSQK
ncbi:interleukin-4 [Neopelma chrysocephalum]|uniref:interleukin-4 n=1 Tax=Neopelma chrysocephalum TaxID=114329 RepID=UPI000FCCE5C8|nr:interleukin-4 [Neopelma chrysocephalum]